LKKTCVQLATRLFRTQKEYFDDWHNYVTNFNIQAERDKPVFKIEQRGKKFNLSLSLNESFFRLAKERANLLIVIQRFDLSFMMMAWPTKFKSESMEVIYPLAMSLKQSLRTF